MKFKFFLPFIYLGFLSCEQLLVREATIEGLETKPKLVVHCYINPLSDLVIANIDYSNPSIYIDTLVDASERSNMVEGVLVSLSDGLNSFKLKYDKEFEKFTLPTDSLLMEPGRTYSLIASDSLGNIISATSVYPKDTLPVDINDLEYENRDTAYNESLGENTYFASVVYPPIESAESYYLLQFDDYYFFEDEGWVNQNSGYVDVWEKKSVHYLTPAGMHKLNFSRSENSNVLEIVVLYTIPYDMYKYYQDYEFFQSVQELPFVEPGSVHSNVEGGYGLFAVVRPQIGFRQMQEILDLR